MTKQTNKVIILLGIILLGMILRTPITSVGAIIGPLKNLLEINNTVAGLITTIPLIAFAIFSPFVAKISNKIGINNEYIINNISNISCNVIFLYNVFRNICNRFWKYK